MLTGHGNRLLFSPDLLLNCSRGATLRADYFAVSTTVPLVIVTGDFGRSL